MRVVCFGVGLTGATQRGVQATRRTYHETARDGPPDDDPVCPVSVSSGCEGSRLPLLCDARPMNTPLKVSVLVVLELSGSAREGPERVFACWWSVVAG